MFAFVCIPKAGWFRFLNSQKQSVGLRNLKFWPQCLCTWDFQVVICKCFVRKRVHYQLAYIVHHYMFRKKPQSLECTSCIHWNVDQFCLLHLFWTRGGKTRPQLWWPWSCSKRSWDAQRFCGKAWLGFSGETPFGIHRWSHQYVNK